MSTNAEDVQIYLDCNNYHSSRSNDPNDIVWKTRYANNAVIQNQLCCFCTRRKLFRYTSIYTNNSQNNIGDSSERAN